MAHSLLKMISNNVAQIAYLNALRYNVKVNASSNHRRIGYHAPTIFLIPRSCSMQHIYFGGFFIRDHPITMAKISDGVKYWSKGTMKVSLLFLSSILFPFLPFSFYFALPCKYLLFIVGFVFLYFCTLLYLSSLFRVRATGHRPALPYCPDLTGFEFVFVFFVFLTFERLFYINLLFLFERLYFVCLSNICSRYYSLFPPTLFLCTCLCLGVFCVCRHSSCCMKGI